MLDLFTTVLYQSVRQCFIYSGSVVRGWGPQTKFAPCSPKKESQSQSLQPNSTTLTCCAQQVEPRIFYRVQGVMSSRSTGIWPFETFVKRVCGLTETNSDHFIVCLFVINSKLCKYWTL